MLRRNFNMSLRAVKGFTLFLLIMECVGGELLETEAFYYFIRTVDAQNVLRISWNGVVPHPCSHRLKGVNCNLQATTITEIRLESLNLSGTIDTDTLCALKNLRVLSLAQNFIRGSISHSILYCRSLTYLNLSSNLLSGEVPVELSKLKHLRTLDISNNHFIGVRPLSGAGRIQIHDLGRFTSPLEAYTPGNSGEDILVAPNGSETVPDKKAPNKTGSSYFFIILGMLVLYLLFMLVALKYRKNSKIAKDRNLKSLTQSPIKIPPPVPRAEAIPAEKPTDIVFFVEEQERFTMDDLLEATADLRSQNLCSSLFKVTLKSKIDYAVKRLKKLQVSFEEFSKTMRQIGNLNHPNILPLVGYSDSGDEKLVIYKYQVNGSLLSLLEDNINSKREFPWKLRLSIAGGIARGLAFIYQKSVQGSEVIPHGNLKPSNILLDINQEPLVSEYGFSRFRDPKRTCPFSSNGYAAPEKTLSEKGDVFSFGIILLELLTGKTVEKSGIDLPKWVRSMVREEWTGEVFDKEVNKAARHYAFSLLNISLKCVSNLPKDRPRMLEVVEKIEEVVYAHEDVSLSSMGSLESSPRDFSLLHTIIPETWDSPGSNY